MVKKLIGLLILTSCNYNIDIILKNKINYEKQMRIKSEFSICSDPDLSSQYIRCLGVLDSGYPCKYYCNNISCTMRNEY